MNTFILTNLMDATDRRVYADWLDDNDQPDLASRQREIADAITDQSMTIPPCVIRVIRKALSYKRKKVSVMIRDRIELRDTHASGGTWSKYTMFRIGPCEKLAVLNSKGESLAAHYPAWLAPEPTYHIPADGVVVEHGMFCGKTASILITVHPDCVPLLLDLMDR